MTSFSPSSLHYNIPLWYSSLYGAFEIIDDSHPRLTAKRLPSEQDKAIISLSCKDWDYSRHAQQECLRLNLGVMVSPDDRAPTSFNPRPGPLSPPPTADDDIQEISADCCTPKKFTVSYSVVIPASQDPNVVFIGWTTAGFRYMASQFCTDLGKVGSFDSTLPYMRFGQHVELVRTRRSYSMSQTTSPDQQLGHPVSTAFLVCLTELLPHSQSLSVPVRYAHVNDVGIC